MRVAPVLLDSCKKVSDVVKYACVSVLVTVSPVFIDRCRLTSGLDDLVIATGER